MKMHGGGVSSKGNDTVSTGFHETITDNRPTSNTNNVALFFVIFLIILILVFLSIYFIFKKTPITNESFMSDIDINLGD